MGNAADSHGFVIVDNGQVVEGKDFDGNRSLSETVKMSNRSGVVIENCKIGASREDCLDIVRGDTLTVRSTDFDANGAIQAVTCKAGFRKLRFIDCNFYGNPKIAYVVLGNYSDYDYHRRQKVKDVEFNNCHFDKKDKAVMLFDADKPRMIDSNGKINKIGWIFRPIVVWCYFNFRKIQQFIFERDRIKRAKEALKNG